MRGSGFLSFFFFGCVAVIEKPASVIFQSICSSCRGNLCAALCFGNEGGNLLMPLETLLATLTCWGGSSQSQSLLLPEAGGRLPPVHSAPHIPN